MPCFASNLFLIIQEMLPQVSDADFLESGKEVNLNTSAPSNIIAS